MAAVMFPCFGGPKDGKFFQANFTPIGYRLFTVRKRTIYLWKAARIERLDFSILARASLMTPDDLPEDEKEDEETPQEEEH